jgi:hypothetical protein
MAGFWFASLLAILFDQSFGPAQATVVCGTQILFLILFTVFRFILSEVSRLECAEESRQFESASGPFVNLFFGEAVRSAVR